MNKTSQQPSQLSHEKLRVYYDGLCILCSREIEHYRRQSGAEEIEFIDICSPQFNAAEERLDPFQIHKVMHVRRPDGTIAIRVQAFIEIWSRIPRYRILSKVAKFPLMNRLLECGYSIFAFFRPYLPKRNPADCSESPYCEVERDK